jgi:CARDB
VTIVFYERRNIVLLFIWSAVAAILGLICVTKMNANPKNPIDAPRISCRKAGVFPNPLRRGQAGKLLYVVSNEGTAPYIGLLKCTWVNLVTGKVDDLPQAYFDGVLHPGQFYSFIHQSDPIISPPGTYQMRVVGAQNDAYCTSQSFSVVSEMERPDLRVQAINVPRSIFPGEKFGLEVVVKNQGSWKSNKFKGRLYWDFRNSFGPSSSPIGGEDVWPVLSASSIAKLSLSKTLPIDLPNGPIFLFYCIDWDREILEEDETNNLSSMPSTVAFRLELDLRPIGFAPYPNVPQGGIVSTDLLLANPSGTTFSGTLAVSLFSPQDSFLLDLAAWQNVNIPPTNSTTFYTGVRASPVLNCPVADRYKVYARYRSHNARVFSVIPLGKRCNGLNPFLINLVEPKRAEIPEKLIKMPSNGKRGRLKMSL